MPGLLPTVDPDGLLEYSVVFTDRSLNHMSQRFQGVMRDITGILKHVYNAPTALIVPGGGTYGMESVARQFAGGKNVLVIRNGWFSYRWTQIFEMGGIPAASTVMKARPLGGGARAPWTPPPINEVVTAIRAQRPDVVFAAHVETASGIILPDEYLSAVATAVHAHGGLFVLDCIASGCIWADMKALGVDVLISAPQKGWSAQPSAGLVMMNAAALELCKSRQTTSFALDLAKWNTIMEAYLNGDEPSVDVELPDWLSCCLCKSIDARLPEKTSVALGSLLLSLSSSLRMLADRRPDCAASCSSSASNGETACSAASCACGISFRRSSSHADAGASGTPARSTTRPTCRRCRSRSITAWVMCA